MCQFEDFNAENKLRIPLSSYAAQIIEGDCLNFEKKKTTLINTIIINYYSQAECSISLRLVDYQNEIKNYMGSSSSTDIESTIKRLINGKSKSLVKKYAKRYHSDINWQITLNKKVKAFLTEDPYTSEEKYYGSKPGHYIRALLEEYARLPYYSREEIVYKHYIDTIGTAIKGECILNLTNNKGNHIIVKPYRMETDRLSMYHYLLGYTMESNDTDYKGSPISIRISRLSDIELMYLRSGALTSKEKHEIETSIENKGVQFLSGEKSTIKIRLSDKGIKKYESQLHLRPTYTSVDPDDNHIFTFECTEAQILFYFISFGEDALVISPEPLRQKFISTYQRAQNAYNKKE